MKTVKDCMSTDLITVTPSCSIKDLAELFVRRRIGAIPVVDDSGMLLGMVTEADLVSRGRSIHVPTVVSLFDWVVYLESEQTLEKELSLMSSQTVEEIYHKNVATCSPNDPISRPADLMADHSITAVPVVECNALKGIVARIDIIRALLSDGL
ncbi:MAG: CBS domain-containing protein [Trichlorobacter sp.]|jgi:CBS domain-containing protein